MPVADDIQGTSRCGGCASLLAPHIMSTHCVCQCSCHLLAGETVEIAGTWNRTLKGKTWLPDENFSGKWVASCP